MLTRTPRRRGFDRPNLVTIAGAAVFAAAALTSLPACDRGAASVEVLSLKDPYFPEQRNSRFDVAAFRVGADRDTHFIARRETSDDAGVSLLREYLYIRTFWHPNPGRSFDDPTQTNAVIRYVAAGENGVNAYTGTAFAYFEDQRGKPADVAVESGVLRLSDVSGDLPDVIGAGRLTGGIHARRENETAARWLREMERLEQRGSLPSDPRGAAATPPRRK